MSLMDEMYAAAGKIGDAMTKLVGHRGSNGKFGVTYV